MTKLLFLCHDLSENAVGRVHVLSQLANVAGFDWTVSGPASAGLWEPVRGEPFADRVAVLGRHFGRRSPRHLANEVIGRHTDIDLLVAVKSHPESLGVALRVARASGLPVLADVDDPDYEALLGAFTTPWLRLAHAARMIQRGGSPLQFRRLQHQVRDLPMTVSNPILRELYGGGTVVPHARHVPAYAPEREDGPVRVVFAGTPRRHKGLEVLREAIAPLGDAMTLTVTAPAPRDARPHERWVGTTSLRDGRELVRSSHIVAVPSLPTGFSSAQLPAKVIDGMVLGRTVLAADTPPIRWALGGTGVLVAAGSVGQLRAGLRKLLDASERRALGRAAHRRAEELFSLRRVGASFATAVAEALVSGPPRSQPRSAR